MGEVRAASGGDGWGHQKQANRRLRDLTLEATMLTLSGNEANGRMGGAGELEAKGTVDRFRILDNRASLFGGGVLSWGSLSAATYDPVNDTLLGKWAAAAAPSPGVYPTTALDSGTWDAYRVRP